MSHDVDFVLHSLFNDLLVGPSLLLDLHSSLAYSELLLLPLEFLAQHFLVIFSCRPLFLSLLVLLVQLILVKRCPFINLVFKATYDTHLVLFNLSNAEIMPQPLPEQRSRPNHTACCATACNLARTTLLRSHRLCITVPYAL